MTTSMDVDLEHFGVKGMRWGVIRDNASSAAGKVANAAKSPQAKAAVKVAAKVGVTAGLSTVGLGALGTLASDPDVIATINSGRKYVNDFLISSTGLDSVIRDTTRLNDYTNSVNPGGVNPRASAR